MAALPFVARALMGPAAGIISDIFRRKGVQTITVRRVSFGVGKRQRSYVTNCAVTKLNALFDFGFGIPEIKEKRDIMIICCFSIVSFLFLL